MAELATIARPYAEALLKASANGIASTLAGEIRALADGMEHALNPRVVDQLFEETADHCRQLELEAPTGGLWADAGAAKTTGAAR